MYVMHRILGFFLTLFDLPNSPDIVLGLLELLLQNKLANLPLQNKLTKIILS